MLPEDLFARQTPSLTAEEYFRFMGAIDALSPDEQTLIVLAAAEGIEAFSPPIFAALLQPQCACVPETAGAV